VFINEMRFSLDVHAVRSKPLDGGMEVVDFQVEQRRGCALVEEQPGAIKVEEE
jgi:hypothetical protein